MLWSPARRALVVGAVALAACIVAIVVVGLTADFVRTLVATFVGAVAGFFIALYLDRVFRAEADGARRRERAEEDEVEREREKTVADARRLAILAIIRDELGRAANGLGTQIRQQHTTLPSDRLSDTLWRSLSASGELRWIDDLALLRTIASAYDQVTAYIDLEEQWRQVSLIGPGVVTEPGIVRSLTGLHALTWDAACRACRAIDTATVEAGAGAGDEIFCR